jgi:hypothetical protein
MAGDGGTGVYTREGTTSRVMAANRPCGEFYDFYSVSPKYFGYHCPTDTNTEIKEVIFNFSVCKLTK